jgi:DNA-binding transcriptional LysR family regulator
VDEASPCGLGAAFEFRHLQYLSVLADELHFGRAADRLFITQPALSQAIARLEGALGVKLFVRSRQSVQLTRAGAEMRQQARRLLAGRVEAARRYGGRTDQACRPIRPAALRLRERAGLVERWG